MPSRLTPAIIQAFADAARRGVPVSTTCRLLDIPQQTFTSWCSDANRDIRSDGRNVSSEAKQLATELVTAIQKAQAESEAEAVERLRNWRSSKTGDDDWRQHAWFLTHGPSRTRWFEHKQQSEGQDQVIPAAFKVVRELSDQDLLDQAKALGLPIPSEPTPALPQIIDVDS